MLRTPKFQAVCLLTAFAFAMLAKSACAQSSPQSLALPATVGEALRNLASRSNVAFAGQVLSIEHKAGVVEIVFSVDQSLLGAAGSSYTLREWAGLWPPGQHRYNIGQCVLIFLHESSAAGLTSPVDGMNGIVPVVSSDFSSAPMLDVRRLIANLQRTQGQPLSSNSTAAISLAEAVQVVSHWRSPLRREPILRPIPLPQPGNPILLPPTLPSPQPILMPLEGESAFNARP